MPDGPARLLADEGFDGRIVRALRARRGDVDLVTIQDLGRELDPDEAVLACAAEERRIVLTRDKATLVPMAWRRVADGLPMPGVIVVPEWYPVGRAVAEITELLALGGRDLNERVVFLPLDKTWLVSEPVPEWAVAERSTYNVPAAALSPLRFSTSLRM